MFNPYYLCLHKIYLPCFSVGLRKLPEIAKNWIFWEIWLDSLLLIYQKLILVIFRGLYWMLGIELRLGTCKAKTLPLHAQFRSCPISEEDNEIDV